MQDQLDVFLGHETAPFLDQLFVTLETSEYLSHAEVAVAEKDKDKKLIEQEKVIRECTPPMDEKARDADAISLSPSISLSASSSLVSPVQVDTKITPVAETIRADNNKRKRRTRSRSRSLERIKRSRSRDIRTIGANEHTREKNIHKYRNKSPPMQQMQSQHNRRRQHLDGRPRHRSQSGSRSRSVSPDNNKKPSRSISPTIGGGTNERGKKSQRCRDFDEKGYCMQGELCCYDHGIDPVVLEDLNNPSILAIPGPTRTLMPEYNPYAPDLWNRGHRPGPAFGRLPPPAFKNISGAVQFPFQLNSAALSQAVERQLVSVPVIGERDDTDVSAMHLQKRRFDGGGADELGVEGPVKRKPPIASRLGARVNPNMLGQQNCSLELRKIPRGLNAIAHLNNHFSKFGKITNIQVSYEGDPEAAIITFSSHAEANVAYRSTEAVLNNRFIKVFWHTPTAGASGGDPSNLNAKTDNVRKNQYHINHKSNEVKLQSSDDTAANQTPPHLSKNLSLVNNTTPAAATSAAPPRMSNPKLKREVAQLARKQKENAVQVACGLTKKKQSLLEGYIKQLSSIVVMLSRADITDAQKNTYKATIKELESKINELRKEISSEHQRIAHAQVQPQGRKTKEQKQKELLDVELDLITQEHVSEKL